MGKHKTEEQKANILSHFGIQSINGQQLVLLT